VTQRGVRAALELPGAQGGQHAVPPRYREGGDLRSLLGGLLPRVPTEFPTVKWSSSMPHVERDAMGAPKSYAHGRLRLHAELCHLGEQRVVERGNRAVGELCRDGLVDRCSTRE
jgi:hypothetical protein